MALAALSIPRRVEITPQRLIIYCLVELTVVETKDIRLVQHLPGHPPWSFPLAGAWGIGGYYGYWFDLRRGRWFKIYATQRGSCLRICRYHGCDIIVDMLWPDLYKGISQTETKMNNDLS